MEELENDIYLDAKAEENLADISYIVRNDPENKVRLMMSFAGENGSVSDPWYTRNFARAYEDIYRGCEALLCNILD